MELQLLVTVSGPCSDIVTWTTLIKLVDDDHVKCMAHSYLNPYYPQALRLQDLDTFIHTQCVPLLSVSQFIFSQTKAKIILVVQPYSR